MKVVNLTPHYITLQLQGDGDKITFEPSGTVARCHAASNQIGILDVGRHSHVPVNLVRLGEVENLPPPAQGVRYLVSRIVADAGKLAGRDDLLIPDDTVRDADGRIIGCRAFAVV